MIKYFELLLDLLEVENKKPFLDIADLIESNKDKKFEFYHQYFFVFEGYVDLLNGLISPEDFLQLGDIDSRLRFHTTKLDSISFLKGNNIIDKDTFYVFDSVAKGILPEMRNVYYC